MEKIKVGVIFGGESVEHEVSIISAMQAIQNMDKDKYYVVPIYITKQREWYTGQLLKDVETYSDFDMLKKYCKNVVLYYKNGRFVLQNKKFPKNIVNEIDIAFPIVHGTNVEDGVLQGYLESIGIPFVGGDVYASVVGQDKVFMKDIFKEADLPMTKFTWFYDSDYYNDKDKVIDDIEKLKYPVIVKPSRTGSSVGIKVCDNRNELMDAIDDAISYDNKILVEEVVKNLKEVNISVFGNYDNEKVSAIEEVTTKNKLLTYQDKYIGSSKTKGAKGGSKGMLSAARKIPADLPKNIQKEIEDIALKAFKVLGSSSVCRIDFLIDDKTKKVYINEINSIPGSLAFYLWEESGIKYRDLLDDMINNGIKNYKKRNKITYSFDSNILQGFAANGVKGIKK